MSSISLSVGFIWSWLISGLLMDNTPSMYLYVKLNWDSYIPVESRDCIDITSYVYRNMSAKGGQLSNPMKCRLSVKNFPTKNMEMLWCQINVKSSVYLVLESEWFFTNRVLLDQILNTFIFEILFFKWSNFFFKVYYEKKLWKGEKNQRSWCLWCGLNFEIGGVFIILSGLWGPHLI